MTQFSALRTHQIYFSAFWAKEKLQKKIRTKIVAVTPTFHARGFNGTESLGWGKDQGLFTPNLSHISTGYEMDESEEGSSERRW